MTVMRHVKHQRRDLYPGTTAGSLGNDPTLVLLRFVCLIRARGIATSPGRADCFGLLPPRSFIVSSILRTIFSFLWVFLCVSAALFPMACGDLENVEFPWGFMDGRAPRPCVTNFQKNRKETTGKKAVALFVRVICSRYLTRNDKIKTMSSGSMQ